MSKAIQVGMKEAKPILSRNLEDARRRVMNLYRAWYRQMPYVIHMYDVPTTVPKLRAKLREEFNKHRNVTDVRLIDLLIFRGQNELVETTNVWKQKTHIMHYFRATENKKPSDFMGKFLNGNS